MVSESPNGEVLGLRMGPSPERAACALQPVLERLLALIREKSCGASSTPEVQQIAVKLNDLCRSLLNPENRRFAPDLADSVIALCNKLLDATPRNANNKELAAALSLVREAVASIDGVEATLQRSLADSADRFDALRHLEDLHLIKVGLARQVDLLKELSAKREVQWRRQMASIERKMRTLEAQLVETRLEARHDPLTGLVNRRSVESSFKLFQESRRQFVLALFDVDDFKRINDTYGHLAGDTALKSIATILQTSVRSHDVVGRFGGDEFVLMMVDLPLAQAERRLLAVLQNLRAAPPIVDYEPAPRITVSCGVAEFSAGDTFETLLARADQALYDAKRAGKNRVGIKTMPYIRDLTGH